MGNLGLNRPWVDQADTHLIGAFNIVNETTTIDLMAALARMYEKPLASNNVFLMKSLFRKKMVEGESVTEHLKKFNAIKSHLGYVRIKFDDEIRALLLLFSFPDSWDGLVTAMSNSFGSGKLAYDYNVGLVLSEDVRKKANGDSSSAALIAGTDKYSSGRSSGRKNSRFRSSKG